MIWLFFEPTSSGVGLVVALVDCAPSAIGMTPAVAGVVVRTIGPPVPALSGSGGTTMLLVSVIELTSEISCRSWRTPLASSHHAFSVTRLNCATRGSCALSAGAGVAKEAAPYQVLIVCCVVRLPTPDSMRAQSIQSVLSGVAGSQSLAGTPSTLAIAACVPSGVRLP